MSASNGKDQESNNEASFAALAINFSLDDGFKAMFLGMQMVNLEDLHFHFANERALCHSVARDRPLMDPALRIQRARLSHVWVSVGQMANDRRYGQSIDICAIAGEMLSDNVLSEMISQFWKRHRLRYPSEIMP